MDCSLPGSSVHRIFRQEYWSGLPFSTPRDFPSPEIKPKSFVFPALAGRVFTTTSLVKPHKPRYLSSIWYFIDVNGENEIFNMREDDLHHLKNVITKIIIICNDWLKKKKPMRYLL